MVVADFHHLLGIDLEAVLWQRSFRWFELRVCGVLAYPDSLLGRQIDADKAKGSPVELVPTPAGMELTA